MLEWATSSCLLILAVMALRAALGRRISPGLRYALWAVVLVRLLVPVQLFTSPVAGLTVAPPPEALKEETLYVLPVQSAPVEEVPSVTAGEGEVLMDANSFGYARLEDEGQTVRRYAARISPLEALGWVWLTGAAAVGTVLLASNLAFSARLRRVRRPLAGAGGPIPVYLAAGLPSPCLFGLFRPAIYVTEQAADPTKSRHVLTHELTHYRHLDHLWSVLRGVALAVHWWNPLVWLAAACSRRDGELACDEGALRRLGDNERIPYGETLLSLVTAKTGPRDLLCCATTMTGEKRSLQKRIIQIACKPKALVSATIAVVLLLTAISVCLFGRKIEGEAEAVDFWETEVLSPTPDLDRDGTPEELQISRGNTSKRELGKLEAFQDGRRLWGSSLYGSGWDSDAYFLCRENGGDCLLELSYGAMPEGFGRAYRYRLFHLEGNQEITDREGKLDFSLEFADDFLDFDPEAIAAFLEEVNGLLSESTPLMLSGGWPFRIQTREDGTLYDNILAEFPDYIGYIPAGLDISEGPSDYDTTEELLAALKEYRSFALQIPEYDISTINRFLMQVTAADIGDISSQDQVTAEELASLLREAVNDRIVSRRSIECRLMAETQAWTWTGAEWVVPLAGGGKLYLIATTTPGEIAVACEASTGVYLSFYKSQELYDIVLAAGDPGSYTENLLPDTPDLDHDGTPDQLFLHTSPEGYWCLQCLLGTGEVWMESSSRGAGQDALFLCRKDGEDYLLRYTPLVGSDGCSYNYKLFHLNGEGGEVKEEDGSLDITYNVEGEGTERFAPLDIAAYMREVNGLLADSTLLVNGSPALAETFRQEGRLYDSLSWLGELRKEGRSMTEALLAYQNRLMAKAAVPTRDEVFSQIREENILETSSEEITPAVLSTMLNQAARSPGADGSGFPEEAEYALEAVFTREGDYGEQRLQLKTSGPAGVVRVTVSGQATAVQYAENPAASGTYLHDEPYSFTEYVKSMSLDNQLVRYGTEED